MMPEKQKQSSAITLNRENAYLRKLYASHLKRLKTVAPKMDNRPVKVNVANLMRLGTVLGDIDGHNRIHNYNIQLLRKLNEIRYATKNDRKERKHLKVGAKELSISLSPSYRNRALEISRKNLEIARRIYEIKNRSQAVDSKTRAKALKCQIGKFKLPEKILAKYHGKVEIPKDVCLQYRFFRPSLFIELEAKRERPIGRITFQLYTEACPMIVLELIKLFMKKQSNKFKISRVYPNLWAECEIAIDSKNLKSLNDIEYDMRALDHESSIGIISMDVRQENLRLLGHGLLVLSISFKPLRVLNGRQVAIGRITNGRRNLIGLSEYGTKNGKPLKDIAVTQLGLLDN